MKSFAIWQKSSIFAVANYLSLFAHLHMIEITKIKLYSVKRLFLFFVAIATLNSAFADYYVAGNGSAGSSWCGGNEWNASGSRMTGTPASITFDNVSAGSYQFKITNGSWSTNWGYSALDQLCSNIQCYGNSDGNVCFSITEAQNLTITFDGSNICLTGDGNNVLDTADMASVGVPAEYEGVMLQGFYWDSYTKTKYSNTKWATLDANYAELIAEDFDLIWLPPSATGGGVGYYAKTYSNQNSDWGSKAALQSLINHLHAQDVKVIADIVINHRQSSNGWTGFSAENFEGYGTWQITSEHLCSGDEAFTSSTSDSKTKPHGAADTGDNDGGCRDLDHTSEYVQDYIKAYLNWMRDSMRYDGWRFDMVKGYLGNYVSMYNVSSQPFFSVGEYWDGNAASLKSYLQSAKFNTTVFDFSLKYSLKSALGTGTNYSSLKNAGMRSVGMEKYAVTFIDNHDTFERSDNQSDEFSGYNANLSQDTHRAKILRANAYILMMPGTPCVFWPHWYSYREAIHELVALRKAAGIHSESLVSDESASSSAYSATVTGHHGSIVLRMGSGRDMSTPAGYTLAITGPQFEIYMSSGVDYTPSVLSSIEDLPLQQVAPAKFIENGHLYIESNGSLFDSTGRRIR